MREGPLTPVALQLIHPRNIDKQHVLQHKVNYNYGLELFSSRRKDFWQLHTSEKVSSMPRATLHPPTPSNLHLDQFRLCCAPDESPPVPLM